MGGGRGGQGEVVDRGNTFFCIEVSRLGSTQTLYVVLCVVFETIEGDLRVFSWGFEAVLECGINEVFFQTQQSLYLGINKNQGAIKAHLPGR